MSDIQVRIASDLSRRLIEGISQPGTREAVVFGLASHASTSTRELVLVRELVIPPESAFLPSAGHGARWSGAFSIELLNRALHRKLGVFIFHAHSGDRTVRMSGDDLGSARELLPRFQTVIPERPHGSVVFSRASAAGVVLMPGNDALTDHVGVRCLQDSWLHTWPLPTATEGEYQDFQRLVIANAPLIRKILKNAVVAVVGLSGGGSQVIPYLAALGVGEIIGVDPQRVDQTNRSSTPNFSWIEAKLGVYKVTAAGWRAWLANRRTRFTGIRASVPEPAALEALKRADIIIGCVNNYHARADLAELAWRYCMPYIDIGLRVMTNSPVPPVEGLERVTGVPGQIFTALPGAPCPWCTDFLTEAKLENETGGRGRPYLQSASGHEAFVSPFNGTLAADAAAEVLRLLSGLGRDRAPRRQYDGQSGALLPMVVKRRADCRFCSDFLAAGDPIWRPIHRA